MFVDLRPLMSSTVLLEIQSAAVSFLVQTDLHGNGVLIILKFGKLKKFLIPPGNNYQFCSARIDT